MSTTEKRTTTEERKYVSAEEYSRVHADYWRVLRESEGFDMEDIVIPPYMSGTITGLISFNCQNRGYPFRELVKRYGMVGLHRYNMLKGTNYKLSSLIKFNVTQTCVCSYYITLFAYDPAARSPDKTFQVRIDEKDHVRLNFVCSIARPKEQKVTTKEPFVPHFHGEPKAVISFQGELPHWPSDAEMKNEKRFYMVTKAEWEETDWISMYMELVICSHDRFITLRDEHFQSKLKIVNVVIETRSEDAEKEKLKAKVAHVYITFKGLAEPQAFQQSFEYGKHVERRAIVRRVICETTGMMSLFGTLCGDKVRVKGQSSKRVRRH